MMTSPSGDQPTRSSHGNHPPTLQLQHQVNMPTPPPPPTRTHLVARFSFRPCVTLSRSYSAPVRSTFTHSALDEPTIFRAATFEGGAGWDLEVRPSNKRRIESEP